MKSLALLPSIFLRLFAGAFALAMVTSLASADVTSADQTFVHDAYQNGIAELRLGQLAKDKTTNAAVEAFAARLIAQHEKANAELKTLADTKGLSLPNSPGVSALAQVKALEAKAGAGFDRAFAATIVRDHQNAVAAFEKAGETTKDTELSSYITKTLLTLKEHLALAQSLREKVSK